MQIIVLGPHRSGTSVVTRIINMMGVYCFGERSSIGWNEENPKGFWERRDVIEANDLLLESQGGTWGNPINWSVDDVTEEIRHEYLHRMRNIILDMDAHRPWVMKDPRLCLTFPILRQLLEVPVVVYTARFPLESAASLERRNKFTLSHGLALWELYAVSGINGTKGLTTIHVDYNGLIKRPLETVNVLYSLLKEAGINPLRMPSEKEVMAFVKDSLWRERFDMHQSKQWLTRHQIHLWQVLRGKVAPHFPEKLSPLAHSVLLQQNIIDQENNTLSSRIEELEKVGEELRGRNEFLEGENLRWQQENKVLSSRIEELEKVGEELRGRNEFLERENQLLRINADKIEHATDLVAGILTGQAADLMSFANIYDKWEFIARHVESLLQQQSLFYSDIGRLEAWLQECQRIINSIANSYSWRIASRIATMAGRLRGYPPSRVMEDINNIFISFDHWRKAKI